MPTDNPKISAYVPQAVYDCFKQFQEEQKLSMSQAAIVILAEYFGIEQTTKETTKGITVGGITLSRIEAIENQLREFAELVEHFKTTNELPISNQVETDVKKQKEESSQLSLLDEPLQDVEPITGHLLARRLRVAKDTPSGARKKGTERFYQWSKEKDPDEIGWKFENKGYVPADELSSELLSKLQEWILKNG